MRKKVWIDTDPAYGEKNGDTDDGYCILALLHSKLIEVVGISACFGNAPLEITYEKLVYLKEKFYPNILIYKGAAGPIVLNTGSSSPQLTQPNEAVIAIGEAFRNMESESKMTIVAVGPVTNIALAFLFYPEIIAKIESVVVVAGRYSHEQHFLFGTNQKKAWRDLNFELDSIAFLILLNSKINLILSGVEVCRSMWLYENDLLHLTEHGDADIQYLSHCSQDWISLWKGLGSEIYQSYHSPRLHKCSYDKLEIVHQSTSHMKNTNKAVNGFHPFDLFAACFVINPDWFEGSYRRAFIQSFRDDTAVDFSKACTFNHDNHTNHINEVPNRDTITKPQLFKNYLIAEPKNIVSQELALDPGVVYYLTKIDPNAKQEILQLLLHDENFIGKLC